MQEPDDNEIIRLFSAEGQRDKALELLIAGYQKRLYWHIRKIVILHDDADDVLQNTFIKAWKGLGDFRGECALFSWLYRIATNESLMFLRKKKRLMTTSIHPIEHALGTQLEDDPYFNGDQAQLRLQQAILTLPEKQRIVFNMRYFDAMPYEAMSQILETSVGALKASYHIAAKKIEEMLVAK